MSDLVGNHKDRFSNVATEIILETLLGWVFDDN